MGSENELVELYEDCLRNAETSIESALSSICSLSGDFPRNELLDALGKIQDAIRGTYVFYDNKDVRIVG